MAANHDWQTISGKRNPPDSSKGYWVRFRNGWEDKHGPWPADGPRWIWGDKPDDWDVTEVRQA